VAGPGTVGNLALGMATVEYGDHVENVMVGLHPNDPLNPGAKIARGLGAKNVSRPVLDPAASRELRDLDRQRRESYGFVRAMSNLETNRRVRHLVRKLGELEGQFARLPESCTNSHFAVALTGLVRKNGVSVLSSIPLGRDSDLILPFTQGNLWDTVIFTKTLCG